MNFLKQAETYVKDNPAQFSELPEHLRIPRAIFREWNREIRFDFDVESKPRNIPRDPVRRINPENHLLRRAERYVADHPSEFAEVEECLKVPRALYREAILREIRFDEVDTRPPGLVTIESKPQITFTT